MKGDFSRFTFDPKKHFSGVRLQQGRVALDADWNEQLDIAAHLHHTATADLVGRSGSPLDGGGFELSLEGENVGISAGRMYVDGVLVENAAEATLLDQPYLPGGVPLPAVDGLYAAYVDVWQRHLTGLEDGDLLEPALGGADTATRQQTVWQVKLEQQLTGLAGDSRCADLVGFRPQLTLPRPTLAARGTRATQENRLYRVEIHRVERDASGAVTAATFKWSRDNGTVAARIANPRLRDIILTRRIDQQPAGGFAAGQWIEVTDEEHMLRGEPGTFARLSAVAGETLTVEAWPGAGDPPDLAGVALVRRWDSQGEMTVEIPVANGGWIALEEGLEIHFDSATAGYLPGDYWVIPVRVEAGVLWPTDEVGQVAYLEPHGPEHHYATLALLRREAGAWSLEEHCLKTFESITDFVNAKVDRTGDVMSGPLTIDEAAFQVVIAGMARLRVLESGRVGIGTGTPEAPVEINGAIKLTTAGPPARKQTLLYHRTTESGSPATVQDDGFRLRYDLDFLGNFADALIIDKTDFNHSVPDGGIVFANTGRGGETRPALTIRGTGNVGLGTTDPRARLEVSGGAIMPAAGNSEDAGILFPRDPFGGSGDRAWIRYYSRGGEATTFEIGTSNDANDHIALMPTAGGVGIGTNAPQAKLQVVGGAIMPAPGFSESAGILFPRDPFGGGGDRAWIRYYSRGGESTTFAMGTSNDGDDHIALLPERGNVGIKRDNPQFPLDVNGVIRSSHFFGFSDGRLKTRIEPLTGSLEKVRALRGVRFEWVEEALARFGSPTEGPQLGLIGQEVEEVVPEVVATDSDGMKSVEYSHLVAILIEAIKELEDRFRGLEAKLVPGGAPA